MVKIIDPFDPHDSNWEPEIKHNENDNNEVVNQEYSITTVSKDGKVAEELLVGMVSDTNVAELLTELEKDGHRLVSVKERNRGDLSRHFSQMGYKFHSVAHCYGVPPQKLQHLLDSIASCDMSKFRTGNPGMNASVEFSYPHPKYPESPSGFFDKTERLHVTVRAYVDRFGKTKFDVHMSYPNTASYRQEFLAGVVEVHPSGVVEIRSHQRSRDMLGEYNCTQLTVQMTNLLIDHLPTLHLRKYRTRPEYYSLRADRCEANTMVFRERFSEPNNL